MEDAIPLSNYELECEMDKNTEKIKKLEKCISDLEKSNVNLGWKLGTLEKEIYKTEAKKHMRLQKAEVTRDSINSWILVLRKAEKDHLVDLDHSDCGDIADILERMLENM